MNYEKKRGFERILDFNKSNGLNGLSYLKHGFNIEPYFIKYKQQKLTSYMC